MQKMPSDDNYTATARTRPLYLSLPNYEDDPLCYFSTMGSLAVKWLTIRENIKYKIKEIMCNNVFLSN